MSWWHRHKHERKECVEIIVLEELEIIIVNEEVHHKKKRLAAEYDFCNFKIRNTMATITIPADKSTVNGQLVPLAADGSAQPFSSIQTDSDNYSSSDTNVVGVSKGVDGAFVVTRGGDAGGSATISYSAINANGETINGSDDFTVDAVVVAPPLATSLSATFSDPT